MLLQMLRKRPHTPPQPRMMPRSPPHLGLASLRPLLHCLKKWTTCPPATLTACKLGLLLRCEGRLTLRRPRALSLPLSPPLAHTPWTRQLGAATSCPRCAATLQQLGRARSRATRAPRFQRVSNPLPPQPSAPALTGCACPSTPPPRCSHSPRPRCRLASRASLAMPRPALRPEEAACGHLPRLLLRTAPPLIAASTCTCSRRSTRQLPHRATRVARSQASPCQRPPRTAALPSRTDRASA